MTDYELTDDDRAALERMKAVERRLIDSGAPPSKLSAGKQEFGIGLNPDGTLNRVSRRRRHDEDAADSPPSD